MSSACLARTLGRMVAAVLLIVTANRASPADAPEYCISVRLVPCRDWCHSRELVFEVTSADDAYLMKRSVNLRRGGRSAGVSGGTSADGTVRRVRVAAVVDEYGTYVQYRVEVLHNSLVVASKTGTIEIGSVDVVRIHPPVPPNC
jgi:hypothetical protein